LVAKRSNPVGKFSSLGDWLAWQESLHIADIELGLDRCASIGHKMGVTKPANIVVSVAGTNGKGSSVALLDAIWRNAGYRVATYTSPHLLRYNERIQINGEPASDEVICAAFERVERARGSTKLTYFEFGTLAALSAFCEASCDIVILEVGLGGRLDAVNIVDADVALIAAIGIDHVEYLGNTRAIIGLEKGGIMRPGARAVCSDPHVPRSLIRMAAELPCELEILGDAYRYTNDGDTWTWWSDGSVKSALPKPQLVGNYQLSNAAGVLKVIDILQHKVATSERAIVAGLRDASLLGRFQVMPGDVEIVLDVAHNAQAVEAFVENLTTLPEANKTHVLLGMMKVKDRASVLRCLNRIADTWHLATIHTRGGATSEELYLSLRNALGKRKRATTYGSVSEAFSGTKSVAKLGDRIIAIGSFVVVSEILGGVQ
jgi:dihydrofolate synthase/folylpolyglutamate synthase